MPSKPNRPIEVCNMGHPRTPENTYITPDGYRPCRKCGYIARKAYGERNRAKRNAWFREHNKIRSKDPVYKAYMQEANKRYRLNNPEKMLARRRLQQAVHKGLITRPSTCEKCKQPKPIQAHHYDYSRAYDVLWLCTKCHEFIHHAKVKELV